jgi:hypothetical protein
MRILVVGAIQGGTIPMCRAIHRAFTDIGQQADLLDFSEFQKEFFDSRNDTERSYQFHLKIKIILLEKVAGFRPDVLFGIAQSPLHDADMLAGFKKAGITPGLAAILPKDDATAKMYVSMKQRDCNEVGIYSEVWEIYKYAPEETERQLCAKIEELNIRDDITAILIQMPLPDFIDKHRPFELLIPEKDVDGLTPKNKGKLMSRYDFKNDILPCTAAGVIELLDRYDETTHTSSMARTTGYTATAAVRLIAEGLYKQPGIIPPEKIGREHRCVEFMLKNLAERKVFYNHTTASE